MRQGGGPFEIFHPLCRKSSKKIEGRPFGEKNVFEKSLNPKKIEGGPLVSPGIVCFAERRKNLFGSVPYYSVVP